MKCNYDRFFMNADYKSPFCDEGPQFIALSAGIMEKSLKELLKVYEK